MSDGLPTDEQLRRIARGVAGRIDRRRRVVRGLVGTTTAVLLLGGGIALVRPGVGSSGASSGGAGGAAAAPVVLVECHASSAADSAATTVRAPGGDPARIVTACGPRAVEQSRGGSATPRVASAPTPLSGPVVLCRAGNGRLHVFPADRRPATLCVRNGMRPY